MICVFQILVTETPGAKKMRQANKDGLGRHNSSESKSSMFCTVSTIDMNEGAFLLTYLSPKTYKTICVYE